MEFETQGWISLSGCHPNRVQAKERVQDQKALIERMKANGEDTEAAERLLATFIEVLDVVQD